MVDVLWLRALKPSSSAAQRRNASLQPGLMCQAPRRRRCCHPQVPQKLCWGGLGLLRRPSKSCNAFVPRCSHHVFVGKEQSGRFGVLRAWCSCRHEGVEALCNTPLLAFHLPTAFFGPKAFMHEKKQFLLWGVLTVFMGYGFVRKLANPNRCFLC